LGQGKDGVLVGRLQHFALSLGEPSSTGDTLTFWAAAIAAGVISASLMAAVVTAGFVSAQSRCIAQLDGPKRPVSTYPKIILYFPPNPLITPST
jgi:hypothetical protein